jgi:hypothetical protein
VTLPAPLFPLDGPFEFLAPSVVQRGHGATVRLPYRLQAAAGPVDLVEEVDLPVALADTPRARAAVRILHLVAGVSYYKCVVPTVLVVPALSPAERRLLTALYDEGLRELAHRNGLAVPLPVELRETAGDVAVRFETATARAGEPGSPVEPAPGTVAALVPVGGGKDSALVASLVPDGLLFAVNPVGAQDHLAAALGRPLLGATRRLDPALRQLVAAGATNGHVPVTAITSAVAVLTAVAVGAAEVIMGIERSADEPSLVTSGGVPVNHQYSKSSEAERLLADAFAPTGVHWFSLLRPLTELAIGAAVAARGLAPHIVSCNRVFTVWNDNEASRTQRACGECAKCLFTALMLGPGSSPEAIADQYGGALLDRPDHVDAVRDLWSDAKPFDCVGERHESAAAVVLLSGRAGWSDQAVIRALAPEARALLAADGCDAASFLEVGAVDALPPTYRDRVRALAADIGRAVSAAASAVPPGSAGATG